MNPVGLLSDPEFQTLPMPQQAALRQEALGAVIIDPDFQQLQKDDPVGAMNFLHQVNSTGNRKQSTGQPIETKALGEPGDFSAAEGDEHPIVGGLLSAITEPTGTIGSIAAGRALAAKGTQALTKAKPTEPVVEVPEVKVTAKAPEPTAQAPTVEPTAQPGEVFSPQVKLERAKEVKDAVIQNVEALGQTTAGQEGQRVSRQVVEAINTGLIEVDSLPGVLQRSGVSMQQFTEELLNTYSTAGKQLNQLSQIRKKMEGLAKTNPEAAKALEALEAEMPDPTAWQKIKDAYTTVDNFRRGLLVTQLATTVRNVISQTGNYSVAAMDEALQQTFQGKGPGAAMEYAARFLGNLKPGAAAQIMKTLDQFPVEQAKLLGSPVGELTLGSKATRFLNTLNIAQEQFFRRTTFDAVVRNSLKEAGMDVEATLANPSSIPENIIEGAVQQALEVTFAAAPKAGTFGKAITDMYKAFPMLTTVNPFPRFWANSIQFLTEYNPAGYLRLLGKDAEGQFLAADPEKRAEILSRATIGTGMLAGALAIRESPLAGAKWYEVKVGDKTIDARPFAPFSTFLFMADVLDTMGEIGAEVVQDGASLKKAMIDHKKYTVADILQGVVSINRIAGTGLALVDVATQGSADRMMDTVRDVAAAYLGGFTVPFKTIKDIAAGFDPEEAKFRDTREDILGPAKANIPGVSQTMPEKPSMLEAKQPASEHPILRQTTGLSVRTAEPVSEEMSRLGIEFKQIAPRTGEPKIDREIAKRMGPMVEAGVRKLIASPAYQNLTNPEIKRFVLTSALVMQRQDATKQLKAERPDLAGMLKLDAIPNAVKDLLISVGGPDLRDAMK